MHNIIKDNSIALSIILFMVLYYTIQALSPGFLYKRDGSLREFGVGYKNKTILPAWLIAIILAILTYILVHSYLL